MKKPRILLVSILGIAGAAMVIGVYSWRLRGGRLSDEVTSMRIQRIRPVAASPAGFDLSLQLPGSPQGLATDGDDLIVGNRSDPWGAMRVNSLAGIYTAKKLPIIEPRYSQKISLYTLTWNGKNYVGYTTAAWFEDGSEKHVFTVHDAGSLKVLSHHAAPDLLGCLAWDGKQYWASTRRHVASDPPPALLYRLDANFKVVSTSPAPGVGCQGLAWDGRHLWFADVFSDQIHVLDVSGSSPVVVSSSSSGLEYLSGIAYFDKAIWVSEYGDQRLHRLREATRLAWSGAPPPVAAPRVTFEASLSGQPEKRATRDESKDSFPDREADDTDIHEWSVEVRDGAIRGSWKLWFGPELFVPREQSSSIVTIPVFSRYTFTVKDPNGTETEKTFDAVAGENVMNDVNLGYATLPGEYSVNLFLHAQFVSADGQARILNQSGTSLEVHR